MGIVNIQMLQIVATESLKANCAQFPGLCVCANCTDAGKGEFMGCKLRCGVMPGVDSLINYVGVSTCDKVKDCGPSWPLLQAALLVEI